MLESVACRKAGRRRYLMLFKCCFCQNGVCMCTCACTRVCVCMCVVCRPCCWLGPRAALSPPRHGSQCEGARSASPQSSVCGGGHVLCCSEGPAAGLAPGDKGGRRRHRAGGGWAQVRASPHRCPHSQWCLWDLAGRRTGYAAVTAASCLVNGQHFRHWLSRRRRELFPEAGLGRLLFPWKAARHILPPCPGAVSGTALKG